jgi:hypothetical protein
MPFVLPVFSDSTWARRQVLLRGCQLLPACCLLFLLNPQSAIYNLKYIYLRSRWRKIAEKGGTEKEKGSEKRWDVRLRRIIANCEFRIANLKKHKPDWTERKRDAGRRKLRKITNHKTQITNKSQWPKFEIPNMFGSLNIGIWDFGIRLLDAGILNSP